MVPWGKSKEAIKRVFKKKGQRGGGGKEDCRRGAVLEGAAQWGTEDLSRSPIAESIKEKG